MKKHLIRTLCIAFILSLCLPMVACDMEFGGLVGELLADKAPNGGVVPDQWESDLVIEDILPDIELETEIAIESTWVDEVFTGDIGYPETETHPTGELPETTSPPYPDGSTDVEPGPIPEPVLFFSFDECDAWIGDQQVQQFFTPGSHASWDGRAVINNGNVEYVRIWGWVAFQSEQIGQVGYRIDDGEPVYDDAFLIEAEQPIINAALAIGAQSATRISVMIPVRQLSGEHVIEIVARDGYEFGYQASIAIFELEKAADPYAPLFVFDPYAIEASLSNYTHDVISGGISTDSSYVTLVCPKGEDPYINLLPYTPLAYTNVKFIVLAYRTEVADRYGQLFVGSDVGPTGQNDCVTFDYVADGAWHTYVLDLSKVDAINASFDLSYLRYDIYPACQAGQSIDIAYVAGFDSMEDLIKFQAQNNLG